MNKDDIDSVAVRKKGGGGYVFVPDQREDKHYPPEGGMQRVFKASEEVKREAQEVRDGLKKAGLLP